MEGLGASKTQGFHCIGLPASCLAGIPHGALPAGDLLASMCPVCPPAVLRRRAGPSQPCIFYLPRLESWALSQVGGCGG